MAQLDDIRLVMKAQGPRRRRQHHRRLHHRQRHRILHWRTAGGLRSPSQGDGDGFRAPAMIRWPGKVPARSKRPDLGLDWFPTLVAAPAIPTSARLKKGKQLGDQTFKVYLDLQPDGHDHRQGPSTGTDLVLRRKRARHRPHRRLQVPLHRQPGGWLGGRPGGRAYLTNLRLDPFERRLATGTKEGAQRYFDWFKYEFWRFVFVRVGRKLSGSWVPADAGAALSAVVVGRQAAIAR